MNLMTFEGGSGAELSTFAKDGYVRCNLPAWTSTANSQSKLKVVSDDSTTSTTPSRMSAMKGKQILGPRLPRTLPPSGACADASATGGIARKAFPSSIYLPSPGEDNSLTIQVGRYEHFCLFSWSSVIRAAHFLP